jgi:hypothetical protein
MGNRGRCPPGDPRAKLAAFGTRLFVDRVCPRSSCGTYRSTRVGAVVALAVDMHFDHGVVAPPVIRRFAAVPMSPKPPCLVSDPVDLLCFVHESVLRAVCAREIVVGRENHVGVGDVSRTSTTRCATLSSSFHPLSEAQLSDCSISAVCAVRGGQARSSGAVTSRDPLAVVVQVREPEMQLTRLGARLLVTADSVT